MIPNSMMRYDALKGRYILTEEALIESGTDLRARLTYNRSFDASSIIARHLERVSQVIYNYIHQFSRDNNRQDELICELEPLQKIIYEAMLCQSEYMLMNGDLSRSVEADKRALAVDMNAVELLNKTVPELGIPITYAGG